MLGQEKNQLIPPLHRIKDFFDTKKQAWTKRMGLNFDATRDGIIFLQCAPKWLFFKVGRDGSSVDDVTGRSGLS